jgi:hypothetical protein
VHLYEAINGTLLSQISNNDKTPGLSVPSGYVQLHTLSVCTAAMLIKEPCLGKDVSANFTVSRNKVGIGQRFYYLEINGAHLKSVPGPQGPKVSGSSDIQGVINFLKGEIRLNYFFSEQDAKAVVELLNKNDYLGATLKIRQEVRNILHGILLQNVGSKVKIIHEALPELYLENYSDHQEQFAPLAAVGEAILAKGKEELIKIVTQLVAKLAEVAGQAIINYFKARAAEFKQAQAQPADGVTVKIIWVNVPGLSKIGAVINAIKGKLTLGNALDLVLPSIPTPVIQIAAGKHFD